MANQELVDVLRGGDALVWNAWREAHPAIVQPDLSRADLSKADLREKAAWPLNRRLKPALFDESDLFGVLRGADLTGADLTGAYLTQADLTGADLTGADLTGAKLTQANLRGANLRGANLTGANLGGADLGEADLTGANLSGAILISASLVEANFADADLTGCRIYGTSAWELKLSPGTKQQNLIITKYNEPEITVDNIEVAQFIYMLLHNEKIRSVIDTVTSKVVLILGRFTDNRKSVLDALRDELRRRNYLPILFDFNKPAGQTITETISLLARMARFVVADITDAKSLPQELGVIVPDLPSVAVQPLLLEGSDEYGMFEHYTRYPWVLKTCRYPSPERLIAELDERVIDPAEAKVRELRGEPR